MNFKPVLALVAAACVSFGVCAAEPASFPAYVNVPSGVYVETDVYPNRTTVVECDFQTSDTANAKYLFGAWAGGFNLLCQLNKTGAYYLPAWGTSQTLSTKCVYHPKGYGGDVRHLVRLSGDGLTVDGLYVYAAATFAPYETTSASTKALRLFNVDGVTSRPFVGKIYRLTVWHGGSLVHNYVPCVDDSGVACLYDTVAKACVRSSTTTAFTAPTEATESNYRIQGGVFQVRVKVSADEAAGRLSLNGGTASSAIETWVAPGTSVKLSATTTDAKSAVFRRWPETIPTTTPESATVSVQANYAIVATNRVFARVNDYVYSSGGDRAFDWNTDWRRGKYPEVDLPEKTENAWARTLDLMYLTNKAPYVTWTYMAEKNGTEGTTMKQGGTYTVGWKLGTVVGDVYHNLGGVVADCYRNFIFEDASQFKGYVRNELDVHRAGWHGPVLHIRPGWTNSLPQFYCMGLSHILTTSEGAGGYASVDRLFGRGLFMVGSRWNNNFGATGSNFILNHLEEGPEGQMFIGYDAPIELRGKLWDVPTVASGAALHLDASLASTRTVQDGNVVKWSDADGGDILATKVGTGTATLGTSTNGLDVIVCGDKAAFQLSKTLQAKELFVVFRDLTAYDAAPPQLVSSGTSSFVTPWERAGSAGVLFIRSKDCSGTSKELEAGEVWLDGTRVEVDATEDFRHALHVVAGGLAAGSSSIAFVGGRPPDQSGAGNVELAEVLVYEDSLTPRERQETCDALRRKWQLKTVSADWDLGSVVVEGLSGGAGSITFAEGRTGFRELKFPASNKTFTKKGAGSLEVGRLVPDGQSVTVEGGRFALRGLSAPVKAEMAPNPSVWLDASQAETLVSDPTDDTLVCRWNDPRGQNEYGQTVYATNYAYAAGGSTRIYGRSPKKVTDTPTGLTALDLGTWQNRQAWISGQMGDAGILEVKNGRFMEGFFVTRHTANNFLLVTDRSWAFFGGTSSQFLHSSYCSGAFVGGYWTINGETYRSDNAPTTIGSYYVIGFKSLKLSTALNYLGMGRDNDDGGGGTTYGEIIYYDRILTDEERRNTEAYLMEKWLGKSHPAAVADSPTVATMTFGAGVTNVVEADCDLTVTNVSPSAAALVKEGSGDVSLGCVDATNLTRIAVKGGTLRATLRTAVGDFLADKAYTRFDASNPSTLTTYVKGGTTYVTRVDHPLGSSGHDVAKRVYTDIPMTRTNDMFLSNAEIGGKSQTVFDFGDYLKATNVVAWTGATTCITNLYIDVPGNSAIMNAGWYYVREAYIVMRETPAAQAGLKPLIAAWPYTFDRESSNPAAICRDGANANRYAGYSFNLDGADVDNSAEYADGWHVLSYCGGDNDQNYITQPRTFGGSHVWGMFNWVSTGIPKQWMHLGGHQIAEFIAFKTPNTADVRAKIRSYLLAKWLRQTTDVSVKTLDRVEIADGSTLELSTKDDFPFSVKAVSGGGTLAVQDSGITDLATVEAHFDAQGNLSYTKVSGEVTFASQVAVNVYMANPAKVKEATHTIFSADALKNVYDVTFKLNIDNRGQRSFRLLKTGTSLQLQPIGLGFVVIFP